ncbi:hypothetical protein X777_07434 [Ooceraea biroi]|uniref:THAP-type domain-containing protein n=1 Tax=Ooceraea biroi TaxID=2015173 RepID=A0A026X2X8_OOCBI|nr:hypothetical protein X777_07434 [Ooceraea biroi]
MHCIAPGCTSGYPSNKEKVHFFYVPAAPYKIPRLRKGTVPSQFPWTEASKINNNENNPEMSADAQNFDLFLNMERQNQILSFDDVIHALDKNEINIPKTWTYTKHSNSDIQLLIFFLPTCSMMKKYDKYTIYIEESPRL